MCVYQMWIMKNLINGTLVVDTWGTRTHTHTHRERERERGREGGREGDHSDTHTHTIRKWYIPSLLMPSVPAMGPGAMLLTRIFCGPHSTAR